MSKETLDFEMERLSRSLFSLIDWLTKVTEEGKAGDYFCLCVIVFVHCALYCLRYDTPCDYRRHCFLKCETPFENPQLFSCLGAASLVPCL